jgi:NAD(P)H dehydrogenase (quinone)
LNVLVVHAHPEVRSFCSALARTATESLTKEGHVVTVNDLYLSGFNPVSGRGNFRTVKDPIYFKQQQEEIHATEQNGFSIEIEAELRKLEQTDLLIFSFPLWWFGMPAILKGWVDRVFAMGRVYGGKQLYEGGLGAKRKARALVMMTTGGGQDAYSDRGVNPSLSAILAPIQHGIFWFNGFLPLEAFVAWSAGRVSERERDVYLELLRSRLSGIFQEAPLQLPPLADFPQFGPDTKRLFKVLITREGVPDDEYYSLIPAEKIRVAELRRAGFILDQSFSPSEHQNWRGFLTVRARSMDEVNSLLMTLPLAPKLSFELHEVA